MTKKLEVKETIDKETTTEVKSRGTIQKAVIEVAVAEKMTRDEVAAKAT
jgi:hypothetical protein